MRRSALIYIGVGSFLGCWVLLFALPCFFRECPLVELVRLTEGVTTNYLLLVVIFAIVSFITTLVVDSAADYLGRFRLFRPKLGDILVQRGYITAEQLMTALHVQKMRFGELLCSSGCLTETQLMDALQRQRRGDSRRLGEILIDLGYTSARDARWAADRMDRKLGQILLDMGLIQKEELRAVLGRQWYGRRHGF